MAQQEQRRSEIGRNQAVSGCPVVLPAVYKGDSSWMDWADTLRVWQLLTDGRMKRNSSGCGYDWSDEQRLHLRGSQKGPGQVTPGV